jgi:hypothetical protein
VASYNVGANADFSEHRVTKVASGHKVFAKWNTSAPENRTGQAHVCKKSDGNFGFNKSFHRIFVA